MISHVDILCGCFCENPLWSHCAATPHSQCSRIVRSVHRPTISTPVTTFRSYSTTASYPERIDGAGFLRTTNRLRRFV